MYRLARPVVRRSRGRTRRAAIATTLIGVAALCGLLAEAPAQTPPGPPNVVVVMTDDQTLESLRVMPEVRSLLADQGTTFTNYFVNYALCCPSRSTYITGQDAHNHGVTTGDGFELLDSSNTLPVWLQAAGYTPVISAST